ncbi:unnamed protein product [Rotaria sp. Silwood2]|nr:unnamed protein product [Rotaria sp. Silwood2]
MSFTFCFTAVNVFASISIGFAYTLNTGGSGVAIWSWILGSFFTILVSLSLAEICSVYPTAGSVYHWYGSDAAFSSGFAIIVNDTLMLNGKSSLSIGGQVGIGIAITLIWTIQNALRIDQQGWMNNIAAVFQISTAISIVIVLLVIAPERATAKDVFTSVYNGTGFPFAYVCCIGILSMIFSFSGYEAGAHLAEETRGARRAGNT